MKFRLLSNQSENGNYNQNFGLDSTRFRKDGSTCESSINHRAAREGKGGEERGGYHPEGSSYQLRSNRAALCEDRARPRELLSNAHKIRRLSTTHRDFFSSAS